MMKFLGNVLSTVVGMFVFFMVLFFGIILIGTLFGGNDTKFEVKKNSVIELDLANIDRKSVV